jgi:hypothetical protein
MKKPTERKHNGKWGKRNRQRIAAGLSPVPHTPLQPEAPQAPSPSILAIQAKVIEELQRMVEDLKIAYLANLTLRPTEKQ